jgi:hypothetical protein
MVFSKISTLLSAALLAGSALAIDPIVMKVRLSTTLQKAKCG